MSSHFFGEICLDSHSRKGYDITIEQGVSIKAGKQTPDIPSDAPVAPTYALRVPMPVPKPMSVTVWLRFAPLPGTL